MPTASYEKFQPAIELMLEGGNLGNDTYALKLANASTLSAGTITETTNGGGYTTGGVAIYKELQKRDDDDVEMLLIGAL